MRPARLAARASIVALTAITLASGVQAQSRVRTEVDTTLVTVGDQITLTVSVEHASGTRVVWPDSLTMSPFEVLGATALPPRATPAGNVSAIEIVVTAFELGELEIPSFEVAVAGPDGEVEVLETDRFGVEVLSVGADEGGDIREIRGPLSIPVSTLWLAGWVLLGVLLMALLVMAYRRFRRRGDDDGMGTRGPPPRPAHELALEALAELAASPMLERGQVKEYHIEVSDILRTYVERRFRVDALEMTTIEVLSGLERSGVDARLLADLKRFLDQCDLVKFAKVRPSIADSEAVLRLGRVLVEDTIPDVVIPDVDMSVDEAAAEPGTGDEVVMSGAASGGEGAP